MTERSNANAGPGRRDFLKAGAAVAAATMLPTGAYAAGSDTIKVGVIGCGGRGSGAAENVLHSAKNVEIVAVGDVFKGQATGLRDRLGNFAKEDKKCNALGNKVSIGENVFDGLEAYKKVISTPDVNYIILATPPGFRPIHLTAAVAAGKNIFTEKPVAVDGPGIRAVMAAHESALKQKLGIAAGTQRRHQAGYIETMKKVHGGDIGEIVGGRGYWNQGILWQRERTKEMSDLHYQIHNWYNFAWLCGDHIVEQHVHNIDVLNWGAKAHPEKAVGMGYRTRTDPRYGHIYDFFAIDFEYPKGVHMLSMCRQIDNCANSVSEALVGTKGTCIPSSYTINGKRAISRAQEAKAVDPYVQEHTDLIESIRKSEPINELKQVAESTLSAIMGRMSAYTGEQVTWKQALESKEELMPKNLSWDMKLSTPEVPQPGKTRVR
jgi:predicted dehydrogenase